MTPPREFSEGPRTTSHHGRTGRRPVRARRPTAAALATLAVAAALALTAFAPAVQAPPIDPTDPVVNGHFELRIPPQAGSLLEGTPADECVGIGHQLFYGSETWQQKAENAALAAAGGEAGNATSNATGAVDQVASDPLGEATFLAGYGHCVFSQEEGYDVVWFNAVHTLRKPALHWSFMDDNTEFGDFTDLSDREVRIGADASASGHNLWQAWPSPHQAYSANFDELYFWVEDGTIPSTARVIVSLSATPLEEQHHWVLLFLDCQLVFDADQLRPNPFGGVSADPTDATFRSRDPSCDDAKAAWDDAAGDSDARRDVLGRLRMVQLSLWGFNRGDDAVVLDGVSLPGTTTFAQEAAFGNHNL